MDRPTSLDLGLLVARLPVLDHAWAHDPQRALDALDALLERVAAGASDGALALRREGELVVAAVESAEALVELGLEVTREPVDGLGVGAAAGWGAALLRRDEVFGAEASAIRKLALLARPGELLCPAGLLGQATVPEGVGAHLAPAALSRLVGAPIHVLRDHR